MKTPILRMTILLVYVSFFAFGQDPPTSAPSIRTFALQPDNVGVASNSVNLFTGDVALPLNLVSLPSNNGLDVNVSISYNSNVQNLVDNWNLESPSGILGLGWTMDFPKIIVDHKQTGTRVDDDYYLVEGGTTNKLIRSTGGNESGLEYYSYETKNYQFWTIKYFYDPLEANGIGNGPNKWVITKEDGTTYIFGDKGSLRNTVQYAVRWGNWIGNSSQTTGQSQLAITWNLSEVINLWNKKITFTYSNVEQFVGSSSGQKHTEASYLTSIKDSYGRLVTFLYKEKDAQYYMEPNVEQSEPDAYQERYEKRYLDQITTYSQVGKEMLSVNFQYTSINSGTNKAKMLLSYVYQKSSNAQTLPGVQLDYYPEGVTNGVQNPKGFLRNVTYPTGTVVNYSYTPTVISRANLTAQQIQPPPADATNPNGYGEAQFFFGKDYIIVAWRGLGPSSNRHDFGPRDVKVYVYQWNGEWKSKFLKTIPSVELVDSNIFFEYLPYKDFQVAIQDNFFAILSRRSQSKYPLGIWYKDEANSSNWNESYQMELDYGTDVPSLMSGENFIAIGSFRSETGSTPNYLFPFTGNGFRMDAQYQNVGDHYYTFANNYFISHNKNLAEFNFTYLTEDKKWKTKKWPTQISFSSTAPSYWYASNSFATTMAGDNPEYIYRWDVAYNNFYRDDVLGKWYDRSRVFNISNSFVGIYDVSTFSGIAARFDGNSWNVSNKMNSYTATFGDDYCVWNVDERVNPIVSYFRRFKPNSLTWVDEDFTFTRNNMFSVGWNAYKAGPGYFTFLNKVYLLKRDGNWLPDPMISLPSGTVLDSHSIMAGSNRFFLFGTAGQVPSKNIQFLKSGALSTKIDVGERYDYPNGFNEGRLVDGNKIITYSNLSFIKDAFSFTLRYIANEQASGAITDYPVTLITTTDGGASTFTSISYNKFTATVDQQCNTTLYNEVDIIPGTKTVSSKPYGFTKTFFHNGLTKSDDSNIATTVSKTQWIGMPYETRYYNTDNSYSYVKNEYVTSLRSILNDLGNAVNSGYYTRLYQSRSTVDGGAELITSNTYDLNTGLMTSSSTGYSTSAETTKSYYKYYSEVYDQSYTRHILSPVVQSKKEVNGQIVEVSANRWKVWTSTISTGSPAPFDTYKWKGSGAPVDFSVWDTNTKPAADWQCLSQISVRSIYSGSPLELVGSGNRIVSQIFDAQEKNLIATISNGSFKNVAYYSFELLDEGNYQFQNYSGQAGSIISGDAKAGESFLKLNNTGLTFSLLAPTEKYNLSFWYKSSGGTLSITGIGTVNLPAVNEWTLLEYNITGNATINLKNTGSSEVQMDEVRLHPASSLMSTFTFDSKFGMTSKTDGTQKTVYTEYDVFGRQLCIRNSNKNILKVYNYNYKK